MDPTAVRSHYLLSLSAPAMVTGVEILLSLSSQGIKHEKLLGTEGAAKGTLNHACVESSTFVSLV
jgi:hypothetical protein